MTQEERKAIMYAQGRANALALQDKAAEVTGTELYAQDGDIPTFAAAKANANMLTRKAGEKDGFVCRSSAGRVVRLIQRYDSETYPGGPETLPAQWRFVWSTDPAKALPFVCITTSPYGKGDCCVFEGKVWRSAHDTNTWSPAEYPGWWEAVEKQ